MLVYLGILEAKHLNYQKNYTERTFSNTLCGIFINVT